MPDFRSIGSRTSRLARLAPVNTATGSAARNHLTEARGAVAEVGQC
jgi:hypothetical protein